MKRMTMKKPDESIADAIHRAMRPQQEDNQ